MLHSRSSFNCLTIGGRHGERPHLTDMRPSTKAYNQSQIGGARSLFWGRRPQPGWLWSLFRVSSACNQRLCLHWEEQLLAAIFNKSRMLSFLWPSDIAYCFLAPSSTWSILATACTEACGSSWCFLEADHALLFPPHLQWCHAGNVKEAVEWIFTQTPQIRAHILLESKPFPLVICS